jgi:hypothetical protein
VGIIGWITCGVLLATGTVRLPPIWSTGGAAAPPVGLIQPLTVVELLLAIVKPIEAQTSQSPAVKFRTDIPVSTPEVRGIEAVERVWLEINSPI